MGGRLLFRDGKDTRLSALGMEVKVEFEKILASENKIQRLARENMHGNLEKLSIGIVSSIAPMRLSRFIHKAMKLLPSSEVIIHPVSRSSGLELVLSGTLDGCFVGDVDDRNPKLSIINLFEERLMLACSRDHRFAAMDEIPAREMAGEVYVDRLNCEFRERVVDILAEQSSVPLPRLRSEREDWLQDVVALGGGVSMVPEHSIIADGIELRLVEGVDLTRRVNFVSISGSGTSMIVREFRDLLKQEKWAA